MTVDPIPEAGKAVRLEGLRKTFSGRGDRRVVAVSNVTLEIRPGELLTLLGPSGCGKTTVLRLIAGLESPTEGRVFIGDTIVNDLPPYKRNVGLVFQSYALFPHLTVFDNAAYALRVRRAPAAHVRHEVERILELVGLERYGSRLPAQLSGGEQQRVALARALVSRPDVLLLDEPLSNLDAKLRSQVRGEIRRIQRALGITAVYVTHDQSEAMSLSDRIAIMQAGRIVQVGRPPEIYRQPASAFVADFVGRANFFSGRVRACGPKAIVVEFLGGVVEVASWSGELQPEDPVCLVIRPEAIRIVSREEAAVTGVVRRIDYQGATAEYHIEVNGQILLGVAELDTEGELPFEGMIVAIRFRRNGLHAILGPRPPDKGASG